MVKDDDSNSSPLIYIPGKAKIPEGTINPNMPRPSGDDFATSKELKDREFSGIRHNSLLDMIEIWTVGDLRASSRVGDLPALAKNYCEVFYIDQVSFYTQVAPTLPRNIKGDK